MSKRDQFPDGTIVQDIVVTTVDSIRYSYIMENNIRNKIPTLFCGPTGTGKSAYTMNVIMNILEKDKYMPIECGFSAQSKA
jgi:dynein heavy chain